MRVHFCRSVGWRLKGPAPSNSGRSSVSAVSHSARCSPRRQGAQQKAFFPPPSTRVCRGRGRDVRRGGRTRAPLCSWRRNACFRCCGRAPPRRAAHGPQRRRQAQGAKGAGSRATGAREPSKPPLPACPPSLRRRLGATCLPSLTPLCTASAQGLYDPAFDTDSCGVGILGELSKIPTRQCVTDGMEMLKRMQVRLRTWSSTLRFFGVRAGAAPLPGEMPDAALRAGASPCRAPLLEPPGGRARPPLRPPAAACLALVSRGTEQANGKATPGWIPSLTTPPPRALVCAPADPSDLYLIPYGSTAGGAGARRTAATARA